MFTYQQHIDEIKQANSITNAGQIASISRWYASGAKKVKRALRRQVTNEKIYTDLVANQQDYQLPAYAERVVAATYNKEGSEWPLIEVANIRAWELLKSYGGQTGVPTHYHIQGDNVVELWPTPSEAIENGLKVQLSFKQPLLTFDDVTTGTATVTLNDEDVTISSSIVTPDWVGRSFTTTDGSHEYWYKIVAYNSSTSFKLENYYSGDSGAGRTYRVGQIVDLPEEAIDLVETYVIGKYVSVYRKNRSLGNDMMQEFKDGIKSLVQDYATPSKSRVVKAKGQMGLDTPYPQWWPVDGLSE